jgi:hypothetical protein
MGAITGTQCHHSPDTSVMMADATSAETSMLGPLFERLRETRSTGLICRRLPIEKASEIFGLPGQAVRGGLGLVTPPGGRLEPSNAPKNGLTRIRQLADESVPVRAQLAAQLTHPRIGNPEHAARATACLARGQRFGKPPVPRRQAC